MKKTLYLIRHGITEGTANRLFYGSTDMPLSAEGRTQVAKLRDAGVYPDAEGAHCFTSGMKRTEETFRIIYGDRKHEVIPELREVDLGSLEMTTFEEAMKHEGTRRWMNGEVDSFAFPGGDDRAGFEERVGRAADFLRTLGLGGSDRCMRVIVVSHGAVITTAMNMFFPEDKEHYWKWIPDPGYGYEIDFDDRAVTGYRKIE